MLALARSTSILGALVIFVAGACTVVAPARVVVAPAAARPVTSAAPQRPREACDDPQRGYECLRAAMRQTEDEREPIFRRACAAGYRPACIYGVPAEDPVATFERYRRLCALGDVRDCQSLEHWMSEGAPRVPAADFGDRWVTRAERLEIEGDSTLELTAHPGARVLLLQNDGHTDRALVTAFLFDGELDVDDPFNDWRTDLESSRNIVVSLPADSLSAEPVALDAPSVRADAVDFARRLYGAPDELGSGLSLGCGPIEIEADLHGNVQLLRQVYQGFEVRGFTRVPLVWSWGDHICQRREIREREPHGDSLPPGLVRVDLRETRRAVKYLERGTPLYQVELDNDSGLRCSRVTYRNHDLAIIHSGHGKSRFEKHYDAGFDEAGRSMLLGPSTRRFDERGKLLSSRATMCGKPAQLVRETANAIELFIADPLFAYDPNDVLRWYKSRAACEQAIDEHPRIRLEPGRRDAVAVRAFTPMLGC